MNKNVPSMLLDIFRRLLEKRCMEFKILSNNLQKYHLINGDKVVKNGLYINKTLKNNIIGKT